MMMVNLSGPHLFGVDVSHHQAPAALKWPLMRLAGCSFAIVRTTYGTMHDRAAREHIAAAREAGLHVGVYHFFRASQSVEEQFAAFRAACDLIGYGLPGDIVPAFDLEDDIDRPLQPAHAELAETFVELLKLNFGRAPLLYITQRDWGRVGTPEWCLRLPQWTAHYSVPSRTQPATPNGIQYAIWQSRVGRFDPKGAHGYYKDDSPQIDHNHARFLPLLDGTKVTPIDALSSVDRLGAERHIADTDRSHEKRERILASMLRAEAQYHATESTFALGESERRAGLREAAGLEPERHDTEPSPPPTEPPPEGEA
jgi:hypothetical protein